MDLTNGNYYFTSESVTEGHPDKIADQISDAILDALLERDAGSRVACEALVTTGMALVAGEISSNCYVDFPKIVRNTIEKIGYTDPSIGFEAKTCAVISTINEQSNDIAIGVDKINPDDQGAGDQGMMFGFACRETPTYIPAPIYWAHQLSQKLADVRKNTINSFLRPDGKTQVSFEYANGRPVKISNVVISSQHSEDVSQEDVADFIKNNVIDPILEPSGYFCRKECKIHINATGRFVVGGPAADCGLTGRKIIQDTYGGVGRHGGGAFSGKDPSKVDRSGAYMARYVAKNIVAAGLAEKCEVQIAYCIGIAEPVSVMVSSFGTGCVSDELLVKAVKEVFDLRPYYISKNLNLLRPIYSKTSCYGHFGRELPEFTWENIDMIEAILAVVSAQG
jgi:S-adenosylmethionine synthetase